MHSQTPLAFFHEREDILCRHTRSTTPKMSRLLVFGLATALLTLLIAWCLVDNFDPKSLRGKKVVICGASTGIGEELAYHYARFGGKVVVVARREEVLKRVVARCIELGAQEAHYIVADLSTLEAQVKVVEVSGAYMEI